MKQSPYLPSRSHALVNKVLETSISIGTLLISQMSGSKCPLTMEGVDTDDGQTERSIWRKKAQRVALF